MNTKKLKKDIAIVLNNYYTMERTLEEAGKLPKTIDVDTTSEKALWRLTDWLTDNNGYETKKTRKAKKTTKKVVKK